jgi:hypothetical protein
MKEKIEKIEEKEQSCFDCNYIQVCSFHEKLTTMIGSLGLSKWIDERNIKEATNNILKAADNCKYFYDRVPF